MFDTRSRGYLNPEELKLMLAFVFDLIPGGRVSKEYTRRILAKVGKTDRENIPKDLIVDYLVEKGAEEKRKVANAMELVE